jgi:Icc-related predicted phosphoesterase
LIRIAATGDMHAHEGQRGMMRGWWRHLDSEADVLVIAGDLTAIGDRKQAAVLAEELAVVSIPVVAVLGNHDYQSDQMPGVREELERRGLFVLEQETVTLEVAGQRIGIAGAKGFGGGFQGACGTAFGEPEMKAFIKHTEAIADRLADDLRGLTTDYRIALMHYAPVEETLTGERLEIYPFLGSYLLGHAIDQGGADLVFHGHAHLGRETGSTARGIPVRNVAMPVIKKPYIVYTLDSKRPEVPGIRPDSHVIETHPH